MDENNVVTAETISADVIADSNAVLKEEPAKTEPTKAESAYTAEIEKLKASLSRANSQAAEYKRQRNEALDKSKLAEVERAEQEQAMREELETLRKEKRVSDYTAKCVALNMDAELAAQTANALADGNMDSVFDCLKAFVEATTTRLNNEALNRQPGLSAGIPPTKNNTVDTDYENMRRWMGAPSRK
jgi:hypothetical protein